MTIEKVGCQITQYPELLNSRRQIIKLLDKSMFLKRYSCIPLSTDAYWSCPSMSKSFVETEAVGVWFWLVKDEFNLASKLQSS